MDLLWDITIIFAVSVAVLYICGRLKIPSIVGLLASGFIAGPDGLGLVKSVEEVRQMAELGVLLLLFTLGIEFSIQRLLRSRRLILLAGVLQVALTIGAVFAAFRMFGVPWNQALFFGFLFSLSSTAIVISILQDRMELDTHHGRIALAILIFQDIAVIPMMLIVPFLSGEEPDTGALFNLAIGIVLVVAVLLLARYVVPKILDRFAKTNNKELFLISILLICFATAGFTFLFGLKLALGAFMAGLIVSESDYGLAALGEIMPFQKVFTSLFFVSIGMLLDFGFARSNFDTILLATAGVMVLKVILIGISGLMLALPLRALIVAALSLSMVGEFAFVLSDVGLDAGLLDGYFYQLFLAISIFSMGVSPFAMRAARRFAIFVARLPGFREWERRIPNRTTKPKAIKRGDGPLVTIIGFGINGRNVAAVCERADVAFQILDFNPHTVQVERESGLPIFYGDATSPAMLRQAGADHADVVVIGISQKQDTAMIVSIVRSINSDAYIIVRTRFVAEVSGLLSHGADEVVSEEFETSLRIAERAMERLGIVGPEIEGHLAQIGKKGRKLKREEPKSDVAG